MNKQEKFSTRNAFWCDLILELNKSGDTSELKTANSIYLDASMLNEWIWDIAKKDGIEYETDIWHETEKENKAEINDTLFLINDMLSLLITKMSSKYHENYFNHDYHNNCIVDGCEECEIETGIFLSEED